MFSSLSFWKMTRLVTDIFGTNHPQGSTRHIESTSCGFINSWRNSESLHHGNTRRDGFPSIKILSFVSSTKVSTSRRHVPFNQGRLFLYHREILTSSFSVFYHSGSTLDVLSSSFGTKPLFARGLPTRCKQDTFSFRTLGRRPYAPETRTKLSVPLKTEQCF